MKHLRIGSVAVTAAVALAALGGCGRDAGEGDRAQDTALHRPGEVRADLLIDVVSLESASRQGDVVVLHVAADSADYAAEHIPGAVYLPLSAVVIDRSGVPNELPPLDEVRAAFEARGVGDDRHVVVYGEPLHAARVFLALDVLGHERVSLLDGGLAAWRAAGGSGVDPAMAGSAAMTGSPKTEIVWSTGDVYEFIGEDEIVLLDARPPAQFAGPESPGRIPTAHSLFWEHTLVSTEVPTLRPVSELRTLFEEAGVRSDALVVTYCRTGMQAGFLYFVARYLGHDVRLYDGSFAAWSSNPRMPVETD